MKQLSRRPWAFFNPYAVLVLAAFLLAPVLPAQVTDVTPATASLTAPGSINFQSVAHGLDRFVAVGGNRSKTSADGVNWTETTLFPDWTGEAPHQARVAFGADRFVAVTDAGAIGHSVDGLTWELAATDGPALYGVTFINNQFFAYGVGGVRYQSSDGKEWAGIAPQDISLQALTRFGDAYVGSAAVTPTSDWEYALPGGSVHLSTDLINWQQRSGWSWNIRRLAVGHGRMVGASFDGRIYSTGNLVSWDIYDSPMATMIRDVVFYQDRFLAIGHGFGGDSGTAVLLESTDGINWTEEALAELNVFFSLAATDENLVLAGLDSGILSLDRTSGQILARFPGPVLSTLHAAFVDNETLFAFGEGGLIKRQGDDGDWFRMNSGTASRLRDAIVRNGVMVAVGDGGTILSSSDGQQWSAASLDGGFSGTFGAVTYGHDQFVAVGEDGAIARSFDGLAWTSSTTGGGEQLWGVTAVPGGFLAAGEAFPEESIPHGVILFSVDGENWERRTIGETPALYGITHAAPGFVAVGACLPGSSSVPVRGVILFSADGFQWEVQESGVPFRLKQVQFSRGRYVVVGELGHVITSLDGKTWQAKDSGSNETLVGLSKHGDRSLLAGEAGTLIERYFGPWIIQGPVGETVDAGDDHTFQVEAEGIGELLYEWYLDGNLIWSSTFSTLDLADIDRSLAGVYTVVVKDDEGAEATLPAPLSVRLTLEHWLRQAGLIDEETAPETIGEVAFQPGSDGVPPFLRYALSADERASLHQLETVEGAAGEHFLTLTFTRLKPPHDLRYEVQVSGDLHSWLPLEALETQVVQADAKSETIRVFDTEPLSERGARAFLRIQVFRE